ncbi:hypothetical protein CANCADRAFT_141978 [Tortispora caseinolytica NRRL Y-17796]|uniref:Uncharacterized protein n=1 Tax=Tortispora caseinolytica NRRL Y-17796 TaxID=767744 RepID=A0A1E4TD86_9ASCO|nr:hypothetical protein CANCADRAFT_141978 [Tortispora caseinolytica NRRL Y-17796]
MDSDCAVVVLAASIVSTACVAWNANRSFIPIDPALPFFGRQPAPTPAPARSHPSSDSWIIASAAAGTGLFLYGLYKFVDPYVFQFVIDAVVCIAQAAALAVVLSTFMDNFYAERLSSGVGMVEFLAFFLVSSILILATKQSYNIVTNIANAVLAYLVCFTVSLPTMKTAILYMLLFWLIDIVYVYGIPVMPALSSSQPSLPCLVFVFNEAKLKLGLGDIIVPSIFLKSIQAYSSTFKRPQFIRLSVSGYLVGILVSGIVACHGDAIPCMMFLAPALLLPNLLLALANRSIDQFLEYHLGEA